ncbi:MAG: putative rane protein [Chloroflexi bacterium]|nr:putative rane protein [Chloroflexota bacterium]
MGLEDHGSTVPVIVMVKGTQPHMAMQKRDTTAWGTVARNEPRWPATVAVIAAISLYLALPSRFIFGPPIALPILEAILIIPLSIVAPHRRVNETRWQRWAAIALIAIINIANVASLVLLIDRLINGGKIVGTNILIAAFEIWLTNIIVFALWYWELDRGGPDDRSMPGHRQPDFLFPQMVTPECTTERWSPAFLDYLFVAFTNATAFSPTDTMPLTPMAKTLMMLQALASLITVALVAARAVNILT